MTWFRSVTEHHTNRMAEAPFVSTGTLPPRELVRKLVGEAHERYRTNVDGELSGVYPALQRVAPDLFGICVAGTSGEVFAVGDADREFSIMSVAKPFVFALVAQEVGAERVREHVGVNATGLAFNSLEALSGDGRTNPMVNPGAIATMSLAPGWSFLHQGLSRFAGRTLEVSDEIYASASESNQRNREIVALLERRGRVYSDPAEALDLYTRVCSLNVTARDLAVMGATLADGGINPVTGERVIDETTCHYALAVMMTAGFYETTGDWIYDVGLPGKSGIGGGIVTVSPGKGGLGTFAPLLDAAGNSVKGQLVARLLSRGLGLDLFVSKPLDRHT
jgi:glutaminase